MTVDEAVLASAVVVLCAVLDDVVLSSFVAVGGVFASLCVSFFFGRSVDVAGVATIVSWIVWFVEREYARELVDDRGFFPLVATASALWIALGIERNRHEIVRPAVFLLAAASTCVPDEPVEGEIGTVTRSAAFAAFFFLLRFRKIGSDDDCPWTYYAASTRWILFVPYAFVFVATYFLVLGALVKSVLTEKRATTTRKDSSSSVASPLPSAVNQKTKSAVVGGERRVTIVDDESKSPRAKFKTTFPHPRHAYVAGGVGKKFFNEESFDHHT